MVSTTSKTNGARVRLKTVVIPPEHGAWGFLLEPIVLGLSVAPSAAGLFLALGVTGGFLVRHPLKLVFTDWRRGQRHARTNLAARAVLVYSTITVLGLVLAVILAGFKIMVPLLLAAPLVIAMLASHIRHRGRDLIPQLAGAGALAATASGIILADHQSSGLAVALWMILNARNVPSILYVRARLRLEKDKPYSWALVFLANVVGIMVIGMLVLIELAPVLTLVALFILLGRALYGLSPYRRRVRTQAIGFLEIGYGLLTVFLSAVGYIFS